MIIVEHRPPLKRADFALKPRAPEPDEPEAIRAIRELTARIENERIWRAVVRASQGGAIEHTSD